MNHIERVKKIEYIKSLIGNGFTYQEISEKLKCPYENLISFCYRWHIKQKTQNMWKREKSETTESIRQDLIENKLKQIEIARKYKVSKQYIHILKKKLVEENE